MAHEKPFSICIQAIVQLKSTVCCLKQYHSTRMKRTYVEPFSPQIQD